MNINPEIIRSLVVFFVPFLFSLCLHEVAHGYVAKLRGDNTAERLGRLTMNPFAHADLFGTFIFPIMSIFMQFPILFGWAKPVPVEARNLKNPRVDMFWIALAGPGSNILLALIGSFILVFAAFKLNLSEHQAVLDLIKQFITINLFLAVYNLIPIHPLDGGKVLARFLPPSLNYKLEQNEAMLSLILLVLIFSGMFTFLIPIIQWAYQLMVGFASLVIR